MAIKLGAGLGAHVTVISRSSAKEADARALGAADFLVSSDASAMDGAGESFDLLIDTVPVEHAIDPYTPLLDIDGTLVLVGQFGTVGNPSTVPLIAGRRRIAGAPFGGLCQTQELLDFCAEKNILPDCEMISIDEINLAYERLTRSDVRYRFVIDMATLKG